jgi:hypothetical protein
MGIDASTVKVTLDGADRELVCTIESVLVMNRAYGGMQKMFDQIQAMDIEAMVLVLQAGLGEIGAKSTEELIGKVFKTGLINVRPALAQFVLLAASGGVLSPDDEEPADDGEPGKT